MATIPRRPGVYQILCLANDKIYVGSAINLAARWKQHCYLLQRGQHYNRHLQRAWDIYETEDFRFSILELVPSDELHLVEQKWINKTGCLDRAIGFNIAKTVGRLIKEFDEFISPQGELVKIKNLTVFCREHGLEAGGMFNIVKGKIYSYRGWTYQNNRRNTNFINPNGDRVTINNLSSFCKNEGLNVDCMWELTRGKRKSYKGWTWRKDPDDTSAE